MISTHIIEYLNTNNFKLKFHKHKDQSCLLVQQTEKTKWHRHSSKIGRGSSNKNYGLMGSKYPFKHHLWGQSVGTVETLEIISQFDTLRTCVRSISENVSKVTVATHLSRLRIWSFIYHWAIWTQRRFCFVFYRWISNKCFIFK